MRRLVALALVAGCGGHVAVHPPALGGEHAATVTFYRDAALIRRTMAVDLAVGKNQIVIDQVARTLLAGSAELRSLSDGGARAVRADYQNGAWGSDALVRLLHRPVTVAARGKQPAVAGELVSVASDQIVVRTADGLRLFARPVEVRAEGDVGGDAPRITWTVTAAQAGRHQLEAGYAARGFSWGVGYTLVLGKDAPTAWFQGWLSIANHSGAPLTADQVVVVDRTLDLRAADAVPSGQPASPNQPVTTTTPPNPNPTPPVVAPPPPRPDAAARHIALDHPLEVPDGSEFQFGLLAESGRQVPMVLSKVFDPVGYELDQAVRKPVAQRAYGVAGRSAPTPVKTFVELDLKAVGLTEDLPAGEVRVFERDADGELEPLGQARAFDRSLFGGDDAPKPVGADNTALNPKSRGVLRLAIGTAGTVTGRRTRTDFAYDLDGKRLIEEFHIALDNKGPSDALIQVREHLYRGLNWSLAYSNQVGELTKEGPQEIQFKVLVPHQDQREVVYRVVYTW